MYDTRRTRVRFPGVLGVAAYGAPSPPLWDDVPIAVPIAPAPVPFEPVELVQEIVTDRDDALNFLMRLRIDPTMKKDHIPMIDKVIGYILRHP